MNSRESEFRRLWGYSVGFYGVWLAHLGRETGLLEALVQNPMSEDDLALSCKLDASIVRIWCSAALSYRFVARRRDGKLHVNSHMASMLTKQNSPDYLGGQFSYLALRSIEYGGFRDFFERRVTRQTSSSFEAIEEATHWDHYAFLRAIARNKKLHTALLKGCSFLDVGCGTGTLIAKLHLRYPLVRLVGLDPSEDAIIRARKATRGMRATLLKFEAEQMEFSGEFDIVYLGEVLYAARDKSRVVVNCHRALKRGGSITILEGLIPKSNKWKNENRLIMGMQLDFALQGHRFLSKPEVSSILRKAKFRNIKIIDLGGNVSLFTATKL